MNGCLSKILVLMFVLLAVLIGYPHLKEYASNSVQNEISGLENKADFVKSFAKKFTNQKLKENDNIENKETRK
jgi:hypothetical protein